MCKLFGISRQSYYKFQKRLDRQQEQHSIILDLVQEQRYLMPRLGTKKVYKIIQPKLQEKGIKFGRDKLFTLLREENQLVRRRKNFTKTTQSYHRFRKYTDLKVDFKVAV